MTDGVTGSSLSNFAAGGGMGVSGGGGLSGGGGVTPGVPGTLDFNLSSNSMYLALRSVGGM
jgi:hypothetical protein